MSNKAKLKENVTSWEGGRVSAEMHRIWRNPPSKQTQWKNQSGTDLDGEGGVLFLSDPFSCHVKRALKVMLQEAGRERLAAHPCAFCTSARVCVCACKQKVSQQQQKRRRKGRADLAEQPFQSELYRCPAPCFPTRVHSHAQLCPSYLSSNQKKKKKNIKGRPLPSAIAELQAK